MKDDLRHGVFSSSFIPHPCLRRQCGLWHASAARAPPDADAASTEPREVTLVDMDTFSDDLLIRADTYRPRDSPCAPRDSPRPPPLIPPFSLVHSVPTAGIKSPISRNHISYE
jgi:hypothetical protein